MRCLFSIFLINFRKKLKMVITEKVTMAQSFIVSASLLFLLISNFRRLDRTVIYFVVAIAIGFFADIFNIIIEQFPAYESYSVAVMSVSVLVFVMPLFVYYLYSTMQNGAFKKVQLLFCFLLVVNFSVFSIFDPNIFKKFPTVVYPVHIILLSLSLFNYIFYLFRISNLKTLKTTYPFWICCGLMIIYLGLFPVLLVGSIFKHELDENILKLGIIIINTLGYIVLMMGIFRTRKAIS